MKRKHKITLISLISIFSVFVFIATRATKKKVKPNFQAKLNFKKSPARKVASKKPLILPKIAKPIKQVETKDIVATENNSTVQISKRMERFLPKGSKLEFFEGESFTENVNGVDVYKEVYTIQTTMPNGSKRAFNAIYNPSKEKIEYTWGMEKSIGSFFKRLKAKRAAKNKNLKL